jgi:Protein of unknown function (DUF550)
MISVIEHGIALVDLVDNHSDWSRETFGSDEVRGPNGPLERLEKEAKEAKENPKDIMEYADCLLLVLDASRRAGFSVYQLLKAAQEKVKMNKRRTWPALQDPNKAIEHIK